MNRLFFKFWIAWRYLFERGGSRLTSSLGILGLSLGVASLFVSMAVISGYETTLKTSLIDMVGHVLVVKRGSSEKKIDNLIEDLSPFMSSIKEYSPFLWLEGLLVHNGKLNGILIEGVDPETVQNVLNFESRVIQGRVDFGFEDKIIKVLVGKGLSQKFNLKINDVFKVAIPTGQDIYSSDVRPKIVKLKLSGVLELGRYDYNQRFIMMDLQSAQSILNKPGRISGVRTLLNDENLADDVSFKINTDLGDPYYAKSWMDHERNMFDAVKLEKRVIFFVLLVIVIAACFNVSSTIYVSVLKKMKDISILQAMGLKKSDVRHIFCLQGLYIGVLGSLFGIVLGLIFCGGFLWIQTHFSILPAEAYKLDFIYLDLRVGDLFWVIMASLLICLCSALIPAAKGANINIVEGVRYE